MGGGRKHKKGHNYVNTTLMVTYQIEWAHISKLYMLEVKTLDYDRDIGKCQSFRKSQSSCILLRKRMAEL